MIFKLKAPVNQKVTDIFLELFLSKGIEENKAKELAQQAKDLSFLITDAEITHRFPDYGPELTDASEDIQKIVDDAVDFVNSGPDAGVFPIGKVMKINE